MSGETRKVRMETHVPSVNAHGATDFRSRPHSAHKADTPGYAAPTRSSSSKTRTSADAADAREHRPRDREHQSKERGHRSKSRDKSRSRATKTDDNRHVAFQAHTLPARLPSAKDFYQEKGTRSSKRRARLSMSADRARVTPPWATNEATVSLNDGCFFSNVRSPRPSFFFIHPEWTSESVTRKRLNIVEKPQVVMTGRRCFSAPPPRSRNPITWEYS